MNKPVLILKCFMTEILPGRVRSISRLYLLYTDCAFIVHSLCNYGTTNAQSVHGQCTNSAQTTPVLVYMKYDA